MKNENDFAPVFSLRFLRALIIHMRPYLLFVSGAAGLAGLALGWQENGSITKLVILFLPFFLGYGFGQALTDCFQTDTDAISAAYRPLIKKEVSPKALGVVSLIGLILIGIPLILYNLNNLIFCSLAIIGLSTYTYFKKNFWIAGPFYNGWIVMILPIAAFLAITGKGLSSLNNSTLIWLCVITLFAYANFVLIGYLKDITADRETGYNTFAVKFGWDHSVVLGDIFVIIVALASLFLINPENTIALALFIIATLVAVSGQIKAHFTSIKIEENATYPIVSTVRAFILWHLAIMVTFQPDWYLFALCYYFGFELVLLFRPEKGQI
ncbi:UbiA family prenyltransferase [uncultured Draconibacterium sp.]|uniref:UbiA family prenyltransferase n=1 Tax=uncultured Draconibacterium sp. TaxID=1573823 RepID=UPI0029C95B76|nr:UbiA family prenyltransferase [uncultured Draconibacterium sp.]